MKLALKLAATGLVVAESALVSQSAIHHQEDEDEGDGHRQEAESAEEVDEPRAAVYMRHDGEGNRGNHKDRHRHDEADHEAAHQFVVPILVRVRGMSASPLT